MGLTISSFFAKLFGKAQVKVLMFGLDSAGKTTALYRLKFGETITAVPTISFNVETLEHKNTTFIVWDFSGQDRIRPLRRHYFHNTHGIIFVVDSDDRQRLDEARVELSRILIEEELDDTVLLILANKQDLPNAMTVPEITHRLGLHTFKNRQWYIQPACATSGEGLSEALDWLSDEARNRART